tara:strand:+ start:6406 stop:7008 length:603 start_codon:yes stop_codon:yes gene_type:complete
MVEEVEAIEEDAETSILTADVAVEETTGEPALEAEDGNADEAKVLGAPENYESFILPEGVPINQEGVDAFMPMAKEMNLSQEQAQQLVNLQIKMMQEGQNANSNAWDSTQKNWSDATKGDLEYGGANLTANLAIARKTLDAFGTPELNEVLESTGAGNHPEIVRLFYRVGKAISEDTIHAGGAPQAPKTREASMFPNMNQ